MRGDASTLGREAALAEAFLKVTPAGRDGTLACVNRIPPELGDLPFPPMVLLPLVHAAADARAHRLALDASVLPAGRGTARVRSVVTIAVPSGRFRARVAGRTACTRWREIVRSYFGADTRLDPAADGKEVAVILNFTLPRSLMQSSAGPEPGTMEPHA